MAVWCEWCDRDYVPVDGWHVFKAYRVACTLWPPAIETVGGP